jgi:hypothetical protein
MELWQRLLVIGVVLALTAVAVRLIDRRIMSSNRSAASIDALPRPAPARSPRIVSIGLLSALLVIPQVRAVAGGCSRRPPSSA